MKHPDTATAALPLPEPEQSPLRAAYARTKLARYGISFDEAMTTWRFRIPLEHMARATARREPRRPA